MSRNLRTASEWRAERSHRSAPQHGHYRGYRRTTVAWPGLAGPGAATTASATSTSESAAAAGDRNRYNSVLGGVGVIYRVSVFDKICSWSWGFDSGECDSVPAAFVRVAAGAREWKRAVGSKTAA